MSVEDKVCPLYCRSINDCEVIAACSPSRRANYGACKVYQANKPKEGVSAAKESVSVEEQSTSFKSRKPSYVMDRPAAKLNRIWSIRGRN